MHVSSICDSYIRFFRTRTAAASTLTQSPSDQFAESAARQLADRILELLQSQPLREQTGVGLRARAERLLGWDTIADQTLEIYQGAGPGKAKGAMAS